MRQLDSESFAQLPGMEPPIMLVEGIIPVGAIGVLAGPSYSGKTFFALELASTVAFQHRDFMRHFSVNRDLPRKHVLFVEQDAPRYDTGRAVWAMNYDIPTQYDPRLEENEDHGWMQQYELARQHLLRMMWHQNLDLRDTEAVLALAEHANKLQTILPGHWERGEGEYPAVGTSLIILDSFRAVHRAAEDKSDEMEPVMANLKLLRDATQSTILLVHHAPKDAKDWFGLRGSTAIEAASDVILKVNQDKKTELVSVTSKKARAIQPEDFEYRIRTKTHNAGRYNPDGTENPDVFKYVEWVDPVEEAKAEAAEELSRRDTFMQWVRKTAAKSGSVEAATRATWAKSNEVPENTVRRWVSELKAAGALKDGSKRGSVLPTEYP